MISSLMPLKAHSDQIKTDIEHPFSCLTRDQQERIVLCAEDNKLCHSELLDLREDLTGAETHNFFYTAGALMVGFLFGHYLR